MAIFNQAAKGLVDALIEQLKKQGFSVIILVCIAALLLYKDNTNSRLIVNENSDLKAENKAIRSQFYGEIINNQRRILENQDRLENVFNNISYSRQNRSRNVNNNNE